MWTATSTGLASWTPPMAIDYLLNHPLVVCVGWTHVHFIWQALLIGSLTAAAMAILTGASAHMRYIVACVGLAAMSVAPMITFAVMISQNEAGFRQQPSHNQAASLTESMAPSTPGSEREMSNASSSSNATAKPDPALVVPPSQSVSRRQVSFKQRTQALLPWLVVAWLVGVSFLALRLTIGLIRIVRWRKECAPIPRTDIQTIAAELSERLKIGFSVPVLSSARTTMPAAMGIFKPVILLPTSVMVGLTPTELHAILAHEMAHIRRHDYLLNLCQRVVETLLFYHPMVWWVSKQIRTERENCCDDMAVKVCGKASTYARALSHLEELRSSPPSLAVSANGGSLIARIRRLRAGDTDHDNTRWPAGAVIWIAIGVFLSGILLPTAYATTTSPEPSPTVAVEAAAPEDEPISIRKGEVVKVDAKTQIEQRVLGDIRLSCGPADQPRKASVDLKYTNVFRYSIIPETVAKQLAATDLGSIDFGDKDPRRTQSEQKEVFDFHLGLVSNPTIGPRPLRPSEISAKLNATEELKVHEVSRPLKDGQTIVPYHDDPLWLPGHLKFYGLNQHDQHKFRVVRIEKVALGVGPSFGPVNALVLDDANSQFGLLGSDWQQQVRGKNGERLFFSAAESMLIFMSPPKPAYPMPVKPSSPLGQMTTESTGREPAIARQDQPGVKVLKSHTYSSSRRQSTDWLTVDGARVPVDEGISHDGITAYMTLMFDVVATESASKRTLWSHNWTKLMPIWRTISIVELTQEGATQLALELYAYNTRENQPIYRYLSLATGKEIEYPLKPAELPMGIIAIDTDKNTVKRAVLHAVNQSRAAAVIERSLRAHRIQPRQLPGSLIENETLVSAEQPSRFANTMDAREILFNLPEGSGIRAELSGTSIEFTKTDEMAAEARITGGRIELIDQGGVVRAWASPDGGAEQLLVNITFENQEYVLRLRSQRVTPVPEYPVAPVQCVMFIQTGAPEDEKQPPHGAVRYRIQDDQEEKITRMKMSWRYDVQRLLDEESNRPGRASQSLRGRQDQPHQPPAIRSLEIESDRGLKGQMQKQDQTNSWGAVAHESGLRSRLTLQTANPKIDQPMLFKLEVKNFGTKPTVINPQHYAAFRVLRALQPDGQSAPYIGPTPQTDSRAQTLNVGQSVTLWENEDAHAYFQLTPGAYEFFAEGGEWATQAFWRDSNRLRVFVEGDTPTPAKQLSWHLNQSIPHPWNASWGWGWATGIDQVFLSHDSDSGAFAHPTIGVWFSPKKLTENEIETFSEKWTISELGQFPAGHLNVGAAKDTHKIWPTYLQDIRAATQSMF